METMTLHKALTELKLIDAKIEKKLAAFNPVGIRQKSVMRSNNMSIEDFEKDAEAKFKSISDLIERKIKIKSAITIKNSITEITVAGTTMTISDAINYKHIIASQSQLAAKMQSDFASMLNSVTDANSRLLATATNLANTALGTEPAIEDNTPISIIDAYMSQHQWELVDPLNAKEKAASINEKIDEFLYTIDAALSEINAITTIEI